MLTTGKSIYVVFKGLHPDGFVLRTINDQYTKVTWRNGMRDDVLTMLIHPWER